METASSNILLSSPASAPSRRGVLASLTGGLFASALVSLNEGDAEARKKGKRKNKKRKNKKKDKNQQPPGPVARADATCSAVEGLGFRTNSNKRIAQTFTAIASGPLVRAELRIFKDAGTSGDYVLHLGAVDNFGVPTNEVLAVASVANRDVPENAESTVSFTFATPFAVKANTQYALVLTRTGSTGSDVLVWRGSPDDLCAGQAFFSPDRTAPFETGTLGNATDFNSTTFVTS